MKTISQTEKNNNKKKRLKKRVVRGLLAIMLAVSLIFYRDSFREIWQGIKQVRVEELWMGILLAGAGYMLEGITISCMMGAVIPNPCIWDGVFIAYACEFYRLTTLGNGSGVAEIHYLCKCGKKKGGIAPGSAVVLTMIQYMLKRIAIMLLGILGFLFLYQKESTRQLCSEYDVFVGAGCLITAAVIAVFLLLSFSDKAAFGVFWILDRLSLRIPSGKEKFWKWKEQIELLNRSGKSILQQKGRMLLTVAIQMGKLLLFYGITAYFLKGKTALSTGKCIFLMALSFMLAGVIPVPSGAGALEFVFLLFFGRFTDGRAAITSILLFRFATWICPAVAGGGLLALRGRRT